MAFVPTLPMSAPNVAATAASTARRPPRASTNRRRTQRLSSVSSSFVSNWASTTTCYNNNNSSNSKTTPRMLVLEVGGTADMDKILEGAGDSLVVVDYSTSWCGPCKIFMPVFEELSEKYSDVVFVKVMGDASPDASELMKREGIRAVPAFHFWRNKERLKDITGARKDDVENTITGFLAAVDATSKS